MFSLEYSSLLSYQFLYFIVLVHFNLYINFIPLPTICKSSVVRTPFNFDAVLAHDADNELVCIVHVSVESHASTAALLDELN